MKGSCTGIQLGVSRFRKRDTIAFMGKKMVKKVKAAGSYIRFELTFKFKRFFGGKQRRS